MSKGWENFVGREGKRIKIKNEMKDQNIISQTKKLKKQKQNIILLREKINQKKKKKKKKKRRMVFFLGTNVLEIKKEKKTNKRLEYHVHSWSTNPSNTPSHSIDTLWKKKMSQHKKNIQDISHPNFSQRRKNPLLRMIYFFGGWIFQD